MNNPINTPATTPQQVTNATEGTTNQVTIQQNPAANPKTKNIDTHLCITIKWSLDSDCHRSADGPPVAAVAAVAADGPGAGGVSC
ncbi:MAG TPA: hypothetical protein VFG33_11840 [Kribbella sp.]|uniref:hypothetical protein n=1 Tax=Kribbella sp. TaxID=1871183 RepID=UPI002D78BAEA|nr:hypothetical protein [Kribbella sp.]HET6294065.1 hypothetical protein [Kribbella sp.]